MEGNHREKKVLSNFLFYLEFAEGRHRTHDSQELIDYSLGEQS